LIHLAKHRTRWLLVVTLMFLAACAPKPAIPTVAILPTDTITNTPTITLTPSYTLTPSRTPTDTPTFTFTPSDTPTPTPTPTNTDTPTNTPTFTPSNTNTPTPTNTPTATFTPLPTSTRTPIPTSTPIPTVNPIIKAFTVEPTQATANGAVIVRWTTDGDSVTLEQLSATNAVIQTAPVPQSGERSFIVTTDSGNTITFRLTAIRSGNTETRTIPVAVQCATPWFVTPAPPGCPQSAPQSTTIIFQPFEQGVAFYVVANNNVYFLANEGNRVNAYPSEWAANLPTPTATPIVPTGRVEPTAQIGYVWYNKAWSDGRQLIAVVGWATAPQQNYSGIIQTGNPPSDVYLTRPDGAVYKLSLAGVGTWSFVSQ